MRSICGVRPARLSCIQRRNIGSKHPGSSCGYPGIAGRHVHSFAPWRRSLYSPPGADGQSTTVASMVMNAGPARSASAIFSASVTGYLSGDCAKDVTGVKRTLVSSFAQILVRIMCFSFLRPALLYERVEEQRQMSCVFLDTLGYYPIHALLECSSCAMCIYVTWI
jgi:hypothetical protein